MKKNITILSHGQALVVLLVFMVVAITMTTMAVALLVINANAASQVEQGDMAVAIAQSGAENAILRLARNPGYTGETLTVDGGSATVTVTGTNPLTVTSVGTYNGFVRGVVASASFLDTVLTVNSWQEVY
ncbi:hypothetical protein A2363_01880 [Candidatus Gottesmanbacteria bacterium RIFOXYB1_FULL_47_11]|uniref:Type 4 fimbrial biogenesis protein PilX N-terminal domain-containing protein n=1 Tax=Candidatus Gottesmanbacteria bacterium RIFOXYB1_FULL_47_11 TaxID=1798401 RepID=A0A1F6BDB2_9BACT|nr:MAG: hypothetical protein A2363_01880 [Candidatus Gottesmanbacteria bacterium RIFOXYB1_FULL_47_11]